MLLPANQPGNFSRRRFAVVSPNILQSPKRTGQLLLGQFAQNHRNDPVGIFDDFIRDRVYFGQHSRGAHTRLRQDGDENIGLHGFLKVAFPPGFLFPLIHPRVDAQRLSQSGGKRTDEVPIRLGMTDKSRWMLLLAHAKIITWSGESKQFAGFARGADSFNGG